MSNTVESMQAEAEEFGQRYNAVREMIGRVIVGHDDIVHGVLTAIFCGGHCLLEGVPGLGKTMLVRTLSEVMDLNYSRIQFTPDLMPADILGTNMIVEDENGRRGFEFQRGPVFTQILLADEINRATPKTQSAMLETMQEGTVTAGVRDSFSKSPSSYLRRRIRLSRRVLTRCPKHSWTASCSNWLLVTAAARI